MRTGFLPPRNADQWQLGWLVVLLIAILTWLSAAARADASRSFTDDVGRQVTLPATINRVFVAGPPAAVVLYTLAPQKLIGWSQKLDDESKGLIAAPYANLPVYGRLTGHGQTVDPETLKQLHPDLILDIGDVDARYKALADQVQQQTGIPYILLNGHLNQTATTYRRLGDVLGVEVRAKLLADAVDHVLQDLPKAIAATDGVKAPKVYYGRGDDGLQSAGRNNINLEWIDLAGGTNVLADQLPAKLTAATQAQILAAQPDAVVGQHQSFIDHLKQDSSWQSLPAVTSHHLYAQPLAPFGWADDPPAVNRLLGAQWLALTLHTSLKWPSLPIVVKSFYETFYQVKLTDDQLKKLLQEAGTTD